MDAVATTGLYPGRHCSSIDESTNDMKSTSVDRMMYRSNHSSIDCEQALAYRGVHRTRSSETSMIKRDPLGRHI
jgi:hypothetical protein